MGRAAAAELGQAPAAMGALLSGAAPSTAASSAMGQAALAAAAVKLQSRLFHCSAKMVAELRCPALG